MGKIEKIRKYLQEYGISYTFRKVYYRYKIKYHVGKKKFPFSISKKTREEQEKYRPKSTVRISLVTALYNTPEKYFREMVASVQAQTYGDWELCLVDASDSGKDLQEIAKKYEKDGRIKYKRLSGNQGISENTNIGISMAQGNYIGIVDHDDLLHPSALYFVAREIAEKGADFVYTDELSFVKNVRRVQSVHLKSDYSREALCSNNYICHFTVFRRKLLKRTGMFQKSMDGAQDYDLFLHLTEVAEKISHVARVLYYWRIHETSSSSGAAAKPYVVEAGKKALEQHLKREGLDGDVSATLFGPFYHVTYKVPPDTRVMVIVEKGGIPFVLGGEKSCISFSVDVISYGEILKKEFAPGEKKYDRVILVRDGYCSINKGHNWLAELVQCLVPKENMVSSSVVVSHDGHICHGGYCYDTEFPEKIRPLYQGVPMSEPGYMNHLAFRQSLSLLGGAALGMEYELFLRVCEERGLERIFSETTWFLACMMAQEMGGECILTPYATFQEENAADGEKKTPDKEDLEEFCRQWEEVLSKPDPHLPEQMKEIGSYYFYW
jgi:hypothetical protein